MRAKHRYQAEQSMARRRRRTTISHWTMGSAGVIALVGIAYAVTKMLSMISTVSAVELRHILLGAGATFLRVEFTLLLAAIWTIPVGVAIGLRP
jgi:NitT/TauT family transport system permease protein